MNLDKFYRRKISISEVIDCARLFNDDDTDKFAKFPYIYISSDEDEAILDLETVCYLDNGPKIMDGKEVFPDLVNENGLDILCSGMYLWMFTMT